MALGTALLLLLVLGPGLRTVAVSAAVAAGGVVAGRRAGGAGALHGGLVAALWIAAEAITDPLFPPPPDVIADTALTLIGDVLRLALGVGAGWLGARRHRG